VGIDLSKEADTGTGGECMPPLLLWCRKSPGVRIKRPLTAPTDARPRGAEAPRCTMVSGENLNYPKIRTTVSWCYRVSEQGQASQRSGRRDDVANDKGYCWSQQVRYKEQC